jgi:hypothetical protein
MAEGVEPGSNRLQRGGASDSESLVASGSGIHFLTYSSKSPPKDGVRCGNTSPTARRSAKPIAASWAGIFPAMTLVVVSGLVEADALLEIEATAVLEAGAAG